MRAKSVKNIALVFVLAFSILAMCSPLAWASYTIQKAVINKGGQLVEMDISFLTNARMANLFVFNDQGNFIIPSHIKSSNSNYYSLGDFTSARMAATGGTVSGGLALLNDYPSFIKSIQPCTVTYDNGQFIIVPPVTGPTLTGITVGDISPVITGTASEPVLTFTVSSATAYSSGSATLSENVSYTIHNANYDIGVNPQCTATTSENLMQTALSLIGLYGGTNFNGSSVLGSTLIANSPLTITLTGASGTTVYTVKFVAGQ